VCVCVCVNVANSIVEAFQFEVGLQSLHNNAYSWLETTASTALRKWNEIFKSD